MAGKKRITLANFDEHIVVFDIETSNISNRDTIADLPIKLSCAYSNRHGSYFHFGPHETRKLVSLLERADRWVGFNSNGFDIKVLRRFGLSRPTRKRSFDLMEVIEKKTRNRYSLEDLAMQQDIRRTKPVFVSLKDHCYHDVKLTKWLYELYASGNLIYDVEKWSTRRNPKKDQLQLGKLAKTKLDILQSVYGDRFQSGRAYKEHLGNLAEDPDLADDDDCLVDEMFSYAVATSKIRWQRGQDQL